jgi:anti-sigma factor RsiW
MTCREFVEFLWRYTADELSPGERAAFNAHIATCQHCDNTYEVIKRRFGLGKKRCSNPMTPSPQKCRKT